MNAINPKSSKKPFYITTTLPYVNAKPHVGHIMEFVRADAIARYKRMSFQFANGQEINSDTDPNVFFNTGTDEHGLKIYQKATEQNKTPQEFVDEQQKNIRDLKEILDISYDKFIRTTDTEHKIAAQKFWNLCKEAGYIYKKNYTGMYCVGCEAFMNEKDLVNGECKDHPGKKLETISEENYFFKFSEFGERLLKLYKGGESTQNEDHKEEEQGDTSAEARPFVIPEARLKEARTMVQNGLEDFSISRLKSKMPWGIEVPGDDEHVMYVWFDALVNYISTLGWAQGEKDGGDGEPGNKNYQKFWEEGETVQICGKDNLQFQAIRWQAMLMSVSLPPTNHIIVNGFITSNGQKMSKTVGNVIDPIEYVNKYGSESVRYFVTRELHPFEDSDFTEEKFIESYNANLANGLGNVVSRVIQMAIMNEIKIEKTELENHIKKTWNEHADYHKLMNGFNLQKSSDLVWDMIKEIDEIISETEPFKLVKTDKEKACEIIRNLYLKVWEIAFFVEPFLPKTAQKIKTAIVNSEKPNALFLRI